MWRWRTSTTNQLSLASILLLSRSAMATSSELSSSASTSNDSAEITLDQEVSSSGSSSRSVSPFEAPPELLDEYTRLLSDQFDLKSTGLLPTQPQRDGDSDGEEAGDGGKPMTKAEKQNAKKKRRKERERQAREQAASSQAPKGSEGSGSDKGTVGESSRSEFQLMDALLMGVRFPTILELSCSAYIDSQTRGGLSTSFVSHVRHI